MPSISPACAVLLATYNGQRWLPEQLASLREQQGVNLHVIVSDDHSSDDSQDILRSWQTSLKLTLLPPPFERLGSANKNFLRMICDADIGSADYVALADQDDIWCENKLRQAIARLTADSAAAYSSDFEAFWPDGRRRRVKKSHPQKPFDHLFGSPGPGCTFVFTRALFLELRVWVMANFKLLSRLWVHDWTLYAYARSRGHLWVIDNTVTIRYRQHKSNEVGVNSGLRAALRRLALVRSGRYRCDALLIAELIEACPQVVRALRGLSWSDRLWLAWHADQFRRSVRDVWALRVIFFLMPASRIS